MITFFSSLAVLLLGYLFYSKIIERIEGIDPNRETPAFSMKDGVDYMPMPWWRIFLIQFLNIAGLGPIFGAVAGAMWGPVAFLWIALGSVFAGAVHDYFSGMLSIKHKGLSITEIVGIYMGVGTKQFMRGFTVLLMVIVGAVFIMGPAKILSGLTPDFASMTFWVWVVFIYYLLATMLPIDKVIGRIYPFFGGALVFMALGLIITLFVKGYHIPELNFESIQNYHVNTEQFPIFPMLFITIACGAISGFHATQSPLMARCITNEKYGRRVFYGAMITEGIVALIWAAISMSFFGGVRQLNEVMTANNGNAAFIVNEISNSLLGTFGGILALLGVVAAPITSGDTAFRSARLIVADFLNFKQGPIKNRLLISIPLFAIGFLLTQIDFSIIWRYFAWSNQTLAMIVLWTITVYLAQEKKFYWITLVPAVFMTAVTSTYLLFAPEGFSLSKDISYSIGGLLSIISLIGFFMYRIKHFKKIYSGNFDEPVSIKSTIMKRRNFIKTTAAGSAFLLTTGAYAFNSNNQKKNKFGFQSERKIPIAYNVDLVVIGGSTAAVAAAVQASRAGAKVFLAAQEPYLGEDVCGTYRMWTEDSTLLNTELGEAIFGDGLPSPLHVKRTLDNALINNNIDFLYSCFVTDLLTDDDGKPAGIVMANRSGRQAVVAKTIIDATPRGLVARMAGASFGVYPAGKQTFQFTVVGNDAKKLAGLSAKIHSEPIKINWTSAGNAADGTFQKADIRYSAIEYTFQIDMKDGSWASFAVAEQIARDLTWDANQVESADLLFQNPPDKVVGQKRWNNANVNLDKINLKVFQPRKIDNLFVLSGSANLSDQAAATLLEPGKLIRIGERVGNQTAIIASSKALSKNPKINGNTNRDFLKGDVGELLEGIRPSLNMGEIIAEETNLPILAEYDVVVMGGGTAGAPAGVGAAQKGAKTLVIDYMHGLGGMGTLGMIGKYYHGYREGYTNIVDKGVKNMGPDNPRKKESLADWVFDWKTEYFRKEIRKAGGDIWFGTIGCGAYVVDGQVKGVVVATPEGKGIVLAHTVIDSTGNADVAIAAGAAYNYTDGNSVAVQGAGFPFKNPNDFYNNTDWTFINDTDMLDVWRAMVVAKDKFKEQYDIGKIPQTRERRRMIGDFTVSVLDVYNGRTYPDTISVHFSSFDTHGFTEDPFFSLKPPAHSGEDVTAFVPFRALLPRGLEGIAVIGLGASAHRDAMPVIRMQPCLQNQGYAVGRAAAMAAANNQKIRYIDIKRLQKELVKIGSMPGHVLTDLDNYPPSFEKIQNATKTVVNELEGLETILWDQEKGIMALSDQFHITQNKEHKLVYARILGMLGNPSGWQELIEAIDKFEDWDEGWNFRGMGQFGKSISYLDSLIIAAGRTKKAEALSTIFRLMEKLTPESEFSHFRAVAIALETISDQDAAEPLFKLLQMPGVRGHVMPDIQTAKKLTPPDKTDVTTRNNSLRELILGRALYKCGDLNGVGNQILNEYSKDLRGHYFRHAKGVLEMFSKQKEPEIEL